MKKSIILLVLTAFAVTSWAQTYKLVYGDDTLSNGDTIVYALTRTDVQYNLVNLPNIYIYKTTDDDVYTDNNIAYVQGTGTFHVSEVCGGGGCPQPGSYKLVSGEIDQLMPLSLHYEFEGSPADGSFAMHHLTVGTIADSIGHGTGDTVGAPLSSLTETTSVYIIVYHGSYNLGVNSPETETFAVTPTAVSAGTPLTVTTGNNAAGHANLYDAAGRLAATAAISSGHAVVATDRLAAGLYLMRLNTANGLTAPQKVIVK